VKPQRKEEKPEHKRNDDHALDQTLPSFKGNLQGG
jgi:hypothetical protein